jgi:hypothetical protein
MTQKSQAMSGSGTLKIGKTTYNLTEVHGAIDYTFGELSHHTKWRWASVTGFLSDKRRFGLNLGAGLIEKDVGASENAMWIGKEVIPLPKMTFEFDTKDTMRPWHVRSTDPKERYMVDIDFVVISRHENHTNLGVISANYEQPVGYWRGSVVDHKTGTKYQFDKAVGLAENQDTKW